jgi:peptide/nickel transport system permease protein
MAAWIVVALTLPLWTPYDPLDPVGARLQPPNGAHWMGTDALGRDVFTRALWGARVSLPIAATVIVAAVLLGTIVGAASGFFGGWADTVLMRIVDITMAFPPILLAMAITASLGPSIRNAAIAMALVWWPIYARLLRAQVVAVRQRDFVDSAIAAGASRWLTLRRYILPMSYTPVLVNATMDFGQVVLLVASLSFIGLGARPPSPEWGAMITEGATNFYQWWIAAAPGLAILTVVLAFNFVGDGLRDTFDVRDDT